MRWRLARNAPGRPGVEQVAAGVGDGKKAQRGRKHAARGSNHQRDSDSASLVPGRTTKCVRRRALKRVSGRCSPSYDIGQQDYRSVADSFPTPAMAKTMAADKNNLRAILRESRQALGPQRADALSAKVQARLIESAFYRSAAAIVLYAAVENEVATDLIAADSIRTGRTVYYPRVDAALRSISIAAIRDPGELKPGPFGIPEPPGGREIVPEQFGLDLPGDALVCVPGVAFSPAGARLGRGGGYYDRMLARLGGAV